ncbi:hypothetical protein [Streptomyces sp. NBC_01237]|uniref:hypothetical protein n=1 Tax=Streptomyces sp. NBC_01237 TaxID=2903790 RepID=UPI002DDB4B3D|nr:hypothetical protein [Streptomyces sp. NBC_01237]WRZ77668.1 hypothetical protein OG251_39310 [Streptomyces sp. NBC_01237]
MSSFPVLAESRRTARGTAALALGHALVAAGLGAGLHHATTDSTVSWPPLLAAVAVLAACAYPVLRAGASRPRQGAFALAAVQALLPAYLEWTGREIPATALDDHRRFPASWHHNTLAMAVLNFVVALALVCFLRSASNLPTRLAYALVALARRWRICLLYAAGLALRLTGIPAPRSAMPPQPAAALPRPRALTVLLYRAQPCAP